ncbi:MAG: DUF4301 family protein, partial [Bacteroidales bacterium]|nr:DUF4301 family protein [Bacteroidales bacterium]
MLNQEDINYLKSFKIHKTLIDEQIRLLNKSDSFLNIYDFASIKNGIKQIENPQIYED